MLTNALERVLKEYRGVYMYIHVRISVHIVTLPGTRVASCGV